MTSPNQPVPQMASVLGLGAYELANGGSENYGQNVDESFVRAIINGPATSLAQAFTSLDHFLEALANYLKTLPLEALQIFKAFIPDPVENAFETVAGAVGEIMKFLGLDNLKMTVQKFQQWVSGVFDTTIQTLHDAWQRLLDTITNALTGVSNTLNTIENLADALLNIPFGNILGILGPANIGDTILNILNHLVGGMVGMNGVGATLGDLFNISKKVSSGSADGTNAWTVLGIRNNSDVASGFLPTGRSNFPLTSALFDSSAPLLAAKQTDTAIATYRIQESSPLGVLSWLGYGTTNLTAMYVNVYKIDNVTGDWALVHHSANIIGDIVAGTTPQFQFYEFPAPLAVVAGEQYAFEIVPVGTGQHNIVGKIQGTWVPTHPTAVIGGYGSSRNDTDPTNPPATIAKASVVWEVGVIWIEVAIEIGDGTGASSFGPLIEYLTESVTVPIPNWANAIDGVIVPAGGGGHQGGTLGFYGTPGEPGLWQAVTWKRGVDFTDADTYIVFVRGNGGQGGGLAAGHANGNNGGTSTLTLNATHVLTAAGGLGGTGLKFGGHPIGKGPGDFDYNDMTCVGGIDQWNYGADGAGPGGAGNGGNWLALSSGGDGAHSAAWLRFRQETIAGEVGSSDTTPPSAPTTVTVVGATPSTLTIQASGSTDA